MGINTRRSDAPALPPLQLQSSAQPSSDSSSHQLYPPTLSSPFPSRQPSRQGSICSFTTASPCASSYGSRRGSEMSLSSFPMPFSSCFSSTTFMNQNMSSSSSSLSSSAGMLDSGDEPRTPLPFGASSIGSLGGGGNTSGHSNNGNGPFPFPFHLGPGSNGPSTGGGGWSSSCSSTKTFAWGNNSNAGGSSSSASVSGATTPIMPSTPAIATSNASGFGFGCELGALMSSSSSSVDPAVVSPADSEVSAIVSSDATATAFAAMATKSATPTSSAAGPIRARRSSMNSGSKSGFGAASAIACELEWTEREEGILQSFLMHPLRPLGGASSSSSGSGSGTPRAGATTASAAARRTTTLYAPGELPPPEVLDELATQVMQYHSSGAPYSRSNAAAGAAAAATGVNAGAGTGHSRSTASMSSSASVPLGLSNASAPSQRPSGAGHRRTHSASGIPWRHTWKQTRKKLFEIARKEAMGLGREDRWKDREASRLRGLSNALFVNTSSGKPAEASTSAAQSQSNVLAWDPPALTPTTASMTAYDFDISSTATPKAAPVVRDVPGGATLIRMRDGALRMQRQGSAIMLEIPEASALDEEVIASSSTAAPVAAKQRLGQVLRLSTSLQRSARASGANNSVNASANTLEPNPVTPTNGTFPRPPSLLQRGRSFTADDFESHMASLMTPSQEDDEASAMEIDDSEDVDDSDVQPSERSLDTTPTKARHVLEHSSMPCGPSPATTDDGSIGPDTPEDVAQCQTSGINIIETPCSPSPSTSRRRAAPLSPHLQLSNKMNLADGPSIDDTPRPCLIRSYSAATCESINSSKPSAFVQFMQGASKAAAATSSGKLACTANGFDLPPLVSPSATEFSKPEFPFAKRQRCNLSLEAPNKLPWTSLDGGLRSPFDDGFGKRM